MASVVRASVRTDNASQLRLAWWRQVASDLSRTITMVIVMKMIMICLTTKMQIKSRIRTRHRSQVLKSSLTLATQHSRESKTQSSRAKAISSTRKKTTLVRLRGRNMMTVLARKCHRVILWLLRSNARWSLGHRASNWMRKA